MKCTVRVVRTGDQYAFCQSWWMRITREQAILYPSKYPHGWETIEEGMKLLVEIANIPKKGWRVTKVFSDEPHS